MNSLATFTPLMRRTVGYDRFNDLLESMMNEPDERSDNYPPFNIEKQSEHEYRITLAVAGFSEKDLNITMQDDKLIVSGHIQQSEEEGEKNYLHRGIAARNFERTYRLADHIQVKDAALKDGLLTIELERIVPDEKKPRMIPIKAGKSLTKKK